MKLMPNLAADIIMIKLKRLFDIMFINRSADLKKKRRNLMKNDDSCLFFGYKIQGNIVIINKYCVLNHFFLSCGHCV